MDCEKEAAIMSCEAMMALTKQEYDRNTSAFLNAMRCHTYSDTPVEYNRQAIMPHDSLCFTHDPDLKKGDYSHQIENMRIESFNKWTRQKIMKDSKKVKHTLETIKNDLDSEYYNCPVNINIPCGIHPTPCRIK